MGRLFGTNGIRGTVNDELHPEFALKVAEAIGSFFRNGEVLLACDSRTSRSMLANAVTSGLISTGCDVYDVGMVPTPCFQYAVKKHGKDGGIMITASHNPPEYNGVKVVGNDGLEIPRQEEVWIEKTFFEGKAKPVEWAEVGQKRALHGVVPEYKEAVKQHVDVIAISRKQYRVVVDAANGVGGVAIPSLLREMGCNVITINADLDGTFPNRNPEPRPENLQDLKMTVKAAGADLGVAVDGDADRSIFVDETGTVQWGDRTFALIQKSFLEKAPFSTIVTPVSSSQVVKDIAEKYRGKLVWTKVGSTIVTQTMKKLDAKLGGEENGGVFFGPHQPVRDAAMTTALVLNIMAETGRKLSTLLAELPNYRLVKAQTACPNQLKALVSKRLIASIQHHETQTIDGVKLWFPHKRSILMRPSGTEPVYRFYAEAPTEAEASRIASQYKTEVQQIITSLQSKSPPKT